RLQSVPGTDGLRSVSCASAKFCEAVGPSADAVWHGVAWRAQAIPASGLTGVSCPSAAFCEAVGDFNNGTVGEAARWNGTKWSTQTPPNPAAATFTRLNAVSCTSPKSCQAAGDFALDDGGTIPAALALAWNGTSWRISHAVTPAAATVNTLAAVSCVS